MACPRFCKNQSSYFLLADSWHGHMEVSIQSMVPPNHPCYFRSFHQKPSRNWGSPNDFRNPPMAENRISVNPLKFPTKHRDWDCIWSCFWGSQHLLRGVWSTRGWSMFIISFQNLALSPLPVQLPQTGRPPHSANPRDGPAMGKNIGETVNSPVFTSLLCWDVHQPKNGESTTVLDLKQQD